MCWSWEWGCELGFGGGCAGDITSVDADLLRTLVHDGYIPVVASVAADPSGQSLNVNADIAAGEARPAAMLKSMSLVGEAAAGSGRDADRQCQQLTERQATCKSSCSQAWCSGPAERRRLLGGIPGV